MGTFARGSLLGAASTAAALLLAGACGSEKPVGLGGECFVATDCVPGLVCVEQKNKSRQCSNDLTSVVGKGPAEGGAADAESDALEAEAPDGEIPDGFVPPVDSGKDTGAPPKDSGTPDAPKDAPADG